MIWNGSHGAAHALLRVIDFCRSVFATAQSASNPSPHTNGEESTALHSPKAGAGILSQSCHLNERDDLGRFTSEHRRKVIDTAKAIRAAMPNKNWKTEL